MKLAGLSWGGFSPDQARAEMVARQIRRRGIASPRVLAAVESVPRHLFVPAEFMQKAYADEPLPIGAGQTISQPYMVAAMSDALSLDGHERVLEIGAGCGYQAAVLSLLAHEVVAVESLPALACTARERLARLGYANVRIVEGDGTLGHPEGAPFGAIIVSAAAPSVPQPLVDQLAEGGRLLVPVGDEQFQTLLRVVKRGGVAVQESLFACRFVPLLGRHGWKAASPALCPQ
jgi:protein-L-isoaspartate(D-aspartate) O-methyltransferase